MTPQLGDLGFETVEVFRRVARRRLGVSGLHFDGLINTEEMYSIVADKYRKFNELV